MTRLPRAAILLGLAVSFFACTEATDGPLVEVTVPPGAPFGQVVDTLVHRGIVKSGTLFSLFARVRGVDRQVHAGQYRLREGQAWGSVLTDLTTGRVVTEAVTVPEGFTLNQMAPRLAGITGLDADSVAAVISALDAEELDVPGPGLEGYLFPDTYRFARGTELDAVVRVMAARYRSFWTDERRQWLVDLGMSEREIVTLASIVQAEAAKVEEMPVIAGVYHNRLALGHPLQADPTILYALGGPRERLLYAAMDSVADSPYNTYTHAGLPPGPIGAPGEAALDAALRPTETDFFYFVARPGGEHTFSETLSEHNRAVTRARRSWDSIRAANASQPGTAGGPRRP